MCNLSCVMINWSICYKFFKWFFKFLGFLLETLCSSHFCQIELNLNLIALHSDMHHDSYFVHASYSFCSISFCANLQSAIGFCFSSWFLFFHLFCILVLILAPCLGRLELIGFPLLHLCLPLGVSFLRTIIVERPLRN